MNNSTDIDFKLRLSSFISESFNDNLPLSASLQCPADEETGETSKPVSQTQSSVGQFPESSSAQSPGDSFYGAAEGVASIAASVEAQRSAVVDLRQNWLAGARKSADASGRLADVTRLHRLSRLLDIGAEMISVQEELKNYFLSVSSGKLSADLRAPTESILKESSLLAEIGECSAEDEPTSNRAIELKIYNCHELMERILRSLLSVATTLRWGVESTTYDSSPKATLLSRTSVERLIMSLPQKYILEAIHLQ